MSPTKHRVLEGFSWIAVLPATLIATIDPDVGRLALGAFGPPADVVCVVWLCAGIVLSMLALLTATRASLTARTRRLGALGAAAVIGLACVVLRGRAFTTRNVTFAGRDITIAATLYVPRTPGRHAAVVFVHGSAPLKRGFYSLWAEHLASSGVVAIVPDKRGVGGTGGEFERMNNTSRRNLELLSGDVVSALDFAARLPEVDTTRLGLFGLSQAGWVAPMAAVQCTRARFLVMITAPAVSVREEGLWSDLRGDDRRSAQFSRAVAERMMDTVTVGGVDVRPRLAALSIPGLWLFGDEDNSVPTRRSILVLDSLRQSGRPFHSMTFPASGHLLFTRAGSLLPHAAPASWDSIDAWMDREIGLRPVGSPGHLPARVVRKDGLVSHRLDRGAPRRIVRGLLMTSAPAHSRVRCRASPPRRRPPRRV